MENVPVMHHVPARTLPEIALAKMVANAAVNQHVAELNVNAMIANNAVVIIAHVQQAAVPASAKQSAK